MLRGADHAERGGDFRRGGLWRSEGLATPSGEYDEVVDHQRPQVPES